MKDKMSITSKTFLGICFVTLCLLTASLFISGCSRSETENSTTVPQSTADTTVSGNTATEKPVESTGESMISKDDAQKAALSHAGISVTDTEKLTNKLEWEDGRQIYEIEFDAQGFEYDYEIDAKTGEILHFSKEAR